MARVALALLLAAAAAAWPEPAEAHQRLLRAEPDRDAVVEAPPSELRLEFLEAVELAFTRITLTGASGAIVLPGELRVTGSPASVLVVPLPHHLPAGTYTVEWATASRDGHPVRGTYTFTIAIPADAGVPGEHGAAVPAPGRTGPPPEHHLTPDAAAFGAESGAYVVIRWLTFIGLLGIIGAVAFAVGVLPMLARRSPGTAAALADGARRRAASVGLAVAALLAVAVAARLHAQSLAMHGPELALDPLRIGTMLRQTLWGWGWLLQAAATLVAGAALLLARSRAGLGWPMAALAALALAMTPALSGHAATMTGMLGTAAMIADTVHVLAAGGWLGSLLLLMVAGLPAAFSLPHGQRTAAVADLVRAFSPLALGFAGLLVTTGVVATLMHSGSLPALLESDYGMVLLVKLALFAVVLAAGAYNFRRVRPALGGEAATERLRRTASLELIAAAAVLLATSVLVATARPYQAAPDAAAAAAAPEAQTGSPE
jgi:putative copper export protein/methionine-rich copper-binding protein CopC